MLKRIERLLKDEKGSGGSSISIMSMVLLLFFVLIMYVLIDFYYMANVYAFVKNQQDLSNRAVYAELDQTHLADRELYIDELVGRQKFEEYLVKNLELNSSNIPARNMRLVGNVVVKEFEIYNTAELPAITPNGKVINTVSVYSEIEIEIQPFLFGRFGNLKFSPRLTTDVPDVLLKTFHP